MPRIEARHTTINYEQQGTGEPLILLPFLTADHACYAFQVPAYAKHFTCFSLDLRGTGATEAPEGSYTTATVADDVAAFMDAMHIDQAHVAGLSFGGGVGLFLAARYPKRVQSLSVHSGWTHTDPYLTAAVEGWQTIAEALGSVPEMVIRAIFPWCFTPELYAARPDYIRSLADFVRSRPAQSLEAFRHQSGAVLTHDVRSALDQITAPTLLTFGDRDMVTSTRFLAPLKDGIRRAEAVVFEHCSHMAMFERVDEFNERTLAFLRGRAVAPAA